MPEPDVQASSAAQTEKKQDDASTSAVGRQSLVEGEGENDASGTPVPRLQLKRVGNHTMRRLGLATEAIKHVNRNVLTMGAGNQARDIMRTHGESNDRNAELTRKGKAWTGRKGDKEFGDSKAEAARSTIAAEYYKAASCDDYSRVTLTYLREHAKGEKLNRCSNQSHSFVVIGDLHGEDNSEWVVADPWPTSPQACIWTDFHLANSDGKGHIYDRTTIWTASPQIVNSESDADTDKELEAGSPLDIARGQVTFAENQRSFGPHSEEETDETLAWLAGDGLLWDAQQTIGDDNDPILYLGDDWDEEQDAEARAQFRADLQESEHLDPGSREMPADYDRRMANARLQAPEAKRRHDAQQREDREQPEAAHAAGAKPGKGKAKARAKAAKAQEQKPKQARQPGKRSWYDPRRYLPSHGGDRAGVDLP